MPVLVREMMVRQYVPLPVGYDTDLSGDELDDTGGASVMRPVIFMSPGGLNQPCI